MTGESPVVDVSSTARVQVLTRDVLDALPTGRTIQGDGAADHGVSLNVPDVGGSRAMQQTYMSTRGLHLGEQHRPGRRPDDERPRRRRRGAAVLQQRHGPGDDLSDQRRGRRRVARRRPHQHHPARRRQHVQRHRSSPRWSDGAWQIQQPDRRAASARLARRRQDRSHLRLQRRSGRADHPRQAVVLRLGAGVVGQRADCRHVLRARRARRRPQCQSGAVACEQGDRRSEDQERDAPPDVADQPAQQVCVCTTTRSTSSAAMG